MGKEYIEGDDDREGIPRYARCEGCNCVLTNEQVDGIPVVLQGVTHYIMWRCEKCAMTELTRLIREAPLPPSK